MAIWTARIDEASRSGAYPVGDRTRDFLSTASRVISILRFGTNMKASVFIGASLDGFIARRNGALDFLPEGGGEEHGYQDFMDSVDALVIGRNTYEIVLGFGGWAYGSKPVYVLTTRPLDSPPPVGAVVEFMSGDPTEIVKTLRKKGLKHIYVDGGITIQSFLREGLIQTLIITRVPVLIGAGIPLFGSLPNDIRLKPINTRQFATGLVQTEYEIL